MAKVSIIVPVYKVEQYLERCVSSLTEQTLKDIEIILVDDGSPDDCPVLCDQVAERDSRVKVLHKKNGGVSAARNDGLKMAVGEYVIFCDSDDWMEVSGLEKLHKKAVASGADIVIGDVYMAKESNNEYVSFYKEEFETEDRNYISELIKADIYRMYCPNPPAEGPAFGYGGPWNKLVKRKLLVDNKIEFDLRVKGIFDDILYTAYILENAKKVAYIQEPVYYYRVIESSITHSYKPNVAEINDAIFKSWNEFFSTLPSWEDFLLPFYACVIRRLQEAVKLYFVNSKNEKSKNVRMKEFKELIRQEPYRTAIKNVDTNVLSKRQKLIVILCKLGLACLIFTVFAGQYQKE